MSFRVPLQFQGKRCARCGHVYENKCKCLENNACMGLVGMRL